VRALSAESKFRDLLTWIYFVQCKSDPSHIKIGITGNLKGRFQALNHSSPQPLKLLGAIRALDFFEVAIHELFADENRHGEWFYPSERLVNFAATLIADYGGRQIPSIRLIEMMTDANLEGQHYAMLTPWFRRAASVLSGQGGSREQTGYRKSDIVFLERLGLISNKPGPSTATLAEAANELYATLGLMPVA
jgi:T5orf172 domain